MSRKRVQTVDFATSADWTVADDARVLSSVLTVTDPIEQLYWTVHRWSSLPNEDGNGDRALSEAVIYKAHDDYDNYELANYGFTFWVKWLSGASGGYLWTYHHYDDLLDEKLRLCCYNAGSVSMREYHYRDEGNLVTNATNFSSATYSWPQDAWVKVRVFCIGTTTYFDVWKEDGTLIHRSFAYPMDRGDTDLGTVAFYLQGVDETWVIGGGTGGTHDNPQLVHPRSGTATLKQTAAKVLPATFLTFDRLFWRYDDANDSELEQKGQVSFRIKVYDAATETWGSWESIGDDGDMSGISANALDKYILEVSLDNGGDLHERWESYPGVIDMALVMDCGWETELPSMTDVLTMLKEEIDGESNITSFSGWSSEHGAIICEESYHPPMHGRACVYITPAPTTRPIVGSGIDGIGGDDPEERHVTRNHHHVFLWPAVIWESDDPSELLVGDDSLEALTRIVENLFSRNDLDGQVHWIEVGDTERDFKGEEQGVTYGMNRIPLSVFIGEDAI